MEEQSIQSLSAPLVLLAVLTFTIVGAWVEKISQKRIISAEDAQILQEIKDLRKEADLLSSPSTFAESTKLRRVAAAKEKELLARKNSKNNKAASKHILRALTVCKICIYAGFALYFRNTPVAVVPSYLFQPIGLLFSPWFSGYTDGFVRIGIIPWLVLTSRFSLLILPKLCHKT